jgi:protocatechuate 3,4-dioxygenase beta subunit
MRALLLSLLVLGLLFGLGFFFLRTQKVDPGQAAGPAAPTVATPTEREPSDLVAPANPARATTPVEPPAEEEAAVSDPTSGNTLSGFVYDASSKPLDNAEVRISADPFMDEDLSMAWFLGKEPSGKAETTRTDSTGRYTFRSLASRPDYFLMADHDDFRPRQESGVFVGDSGDFTGPDFYLVTGATLTGYVVDVGANPVPDAVLHLDSAYMMGENQVSPDRMTTKSNESGFFEFKHVPPGPRNLTCIAEGYGNQVLHNIQFEPDQPDQLEERTLTLEVGEPIAGRVFGPDNEPVVGAHIMAMKYSNAVSSRGEAVTDENGNFMIPDLAQGSYNLSVNAKAYRVARHNRVQVGDVNVQVEMIKQACVSGRVLDADGQPVSDFTAVVLRAAPTTNDPQQAPIYENTEVSEKIEASADGSYTICGLSPGSFVLKIRAKGLAPSLSQSFTVADGQVLPDVAVRLSRGGSIKGRLVDASGAGVGGARLSTLDDEHGDSNLDPFLGGLVDTSTTQRKGKSDAEGYFELDLLNPGRYRLKIEHGTFTTELLRGVVVTEASAADVGSITLQSGGVVKGTLFDGSGAAVPRGMVRLFRADHDETFSYQVRSDAQGNYAIEHVKPGSYRLSATRDNDAANAFEGLIDQQSSEVLINVVDGTTVTRELRLGG